MVKFGTMANSDWVFVLFGVYLGFFVFLEKN